MPRKPADQKALGRVSDRTNTEAAVVQREKRTEKSKHGEGLQEKARIKVFCLLMAATDFH